jgi:hypothetical protein
MWNNSVQNFEQTWKKHSTKWLLENKRKSKEELIPWVVGGNTSSIQEKKHAQDAPPSTFYMLGHARFLH